MAESASTITIIGGGLAGCEAAWQAVLLGVKVRLIDMKPDSMPAAHRSPHLAELVCSNSFRGAALVNAVGLLKEEMRLLGSVVMELAEITKVPAGGALAVDREEFARGVTEKVLGHPLVSFETAEVESLPEVGPVIVATGPLTTPRLAEEIGRVLPGEQLSFYDAIAPIVETESLDLDRVYSASRYGKGGDDYLNCAFDGPTYTRFIEELRSSEKVEIHSFEDPAYFEGCMPIEVLASRGEDVLRFGPLKPVGLRHPVTGESAHAVLQLRKENTEGSAHNLVGCQTRMTRPEQLRVFRMVPGLEKARFLRYGQVHRNTFVNAPESLLPDLRLRGAEHVRLAGQMTGVEGYVESAACGLLAGLFAAREVLGRPHLPPPPTTAHGALLTHLAGGDRPSFQPSNCTWALFPALPGRMPKRIRKQRRAERGLRDLEAWRKELGADLP